MEGGGLELNRPQRILEVGDEVVRVLDVDKTGYPFRCTIISHNYPDPEQAFWVCKNYRERWRGPPATASDPDKRTFKRLSLIAGYERLGTERKARKQWFKDHPDERPACYPARARPDRLD